METGTRSDPHHPVWSMPDRLRVLAVEDSQADFLLMERELTRHGIAADCVRADTFEDISALMSGRVWDVVLMDYNVPGLSIQELMAFFRAHHPDVPVIMLSGTLGEERAVEMLRMGFWDLVLKDNLARLIPAIERCLREADERRRRHVSEGQLEVARQYLNNIIDSMPSVVVGVDERLRVTFHNQAAASRLAAPAENAVGVELERAFPSLSAHGNEIIKAIRERTPLRIENQPHTQGHETHFQDVLIYPLMEEGAQGAVLRIDDVTERVRISEMMVQAEKMMSLAGLAAGMAHEINNPLSSIIQSAQVIHSRMDPGREGNLKAARKCGCSMEAVHCYLDKRQILDFTLAIQEAGVRASKIVRNMLAFSRKSDMLLEPANINEILEKSLELASTDYDLKKKYDFGRLAIVREYAPDLPPLSCVRSEIEQVIFNLLKNSAQAISRAPEKDKTPAITLRTRRMEQGICIEVEDNGPGMVERIRKHVFEPFFTTKEQGVGTGLGLSVSFFIIVSHHKGRIYVESWPGKGSRFVILLPFDLKSVAPLY